MFIPEDDESRLRLRREFLEQIQGKAYNSVLYKLYIEEQLIRTRETLFTLQTAISTQ